MLSKSSNYGEFILMANYITKQDTSSKIYNITSKLVVRKEITELEHAETRG